VKSVGERELSDHQRLQYQFAAHLRDPQHQPAPSGIEDRRLQIYRELFYNNVEDFLKTAFPVLKQITADERWHAMARDFYARHHCREPQFYRIAEEFLRYLDDERGAVAGDPPFLRELAHYEWVELALAVSDIELTPELADPNGDLLVGTPVVSPLAWTLAYDFPVHKIAPDFQPASAPAEPTLLVVYRNRADDVKFMEINPITARLLQLVEEAPDAGGKLLQRIADEINHPQPQAVIAEGKEIFASLRRRDIILGTRR
jgi:uncharacterized protein